MPPVRPSPSTCRPASRSSGSRILAALLAAGAIAVSTAAAAQGREESSLAAAAATVKGAAIQALNTAQNLSSFALELIGIRYKWGGETPATGLDCSGLVRYVFQKVTGVTLPRTAKDMSRLGEQVAVPDLQPGDLVFFDTRHFAFSHVGIYLGDNRFVHAPRQGREVEVATFDTSFWQKHFNGARRMVGVLPDFIPQMISDAVAAPLDALPALPEPEARVSGTLMPVVPVTSAETSSPPDEPRP